MPYLLCWLFSKLFLLLFKIGFDSKFLKKLCDTAVINIALAIPNINFRTPNSKPIKENVLTNILINYTKKIGSFIGNCNVFAAVLSLRVELTKIKSVLIIKMMSLPTNQKIKTNQILME